MRGLIAPHRGRCLKALTAMVKPKVRWRRSQAAFPTAIQKNYRTIIEQGRALWCAAPLHRSAIQFAGQSPENQWLVPPYGENPTKKPPVGAASVRCEREFDRFRIFEHFLESCPPACGGGLRDHPAIGRRARAQCIFTATALPLPAVRRDTSPTRGRDPGSCPCA